MIEVPWKISNLKELIDNAYGTIYPMGHNSDLRLLITAYDKQSFSITLYTILNTENRDSMDIFGSFVETKGITIKISHVDRIVIPINSFSLEKLKTVL
jgi:hypothetical protein